MKKLIYRLLVFVVVISVFVACDKSDQSTIKSENTLPTDEGHKKPINLAVVLRDAEISPADVALYQELEKETGVKINWHTATKAGWAEKRALLFASNDLPEAFFGSSILDDDDVFKYGERGLLVPIERYITPELMPNLSTVFEAHPEYLKAITAPDGHIYALPAFDDGIVTTTSEPLYINRDWLEAVNMEMPTTLDEYYRVLKAFKDNDVNGNGDPDDEIPLVFSEEISDMFGAFGIIDNMDTHIDVTNGVVYYTAVTNEYKNAISYFNMLFAEGLVDPEAFTQDDKALKAKLKAQERIAGSFQSWRSTGWAIEEGDDSYIPVPPMAGPEGIRMWRERENGIKSKGAFAITYFAEDPEYIAKWVDHVYDPEFALQASFAFKIGTHAKYNEEGKLEMIMEPTAENRTGLVPKGLERIFAMTEVSAGLLNEVPEHMLEKQNLDSYYNDFYKKEYYPSVFFTLQEAEELAILKTDILSYTNEMYARWIVAGGIEDEWDDYVEVLNKMGLERLVEIHQRALDRFNS